MSQSFCNLERGQQDAADQQQTFCDNLQLGVNSTAFQHQQPCNQTVASEPPQVAIRQNSCMLLHTHTAQPSHGRGFIQLIKT